MKKFSLLMILVLMVALLPAALASAQDLHRSYNIGAGSYIRVQNISGDIRVIGVAGTTVAVDAVVVGPDRQMISIEDLSTNNGIELRVKYPQTGNTNASVNFEVRVPSMVDYNFDRVNSVSGSVEVTGVRGRLKINSVSGEVTAKEITGTVNANSVSGDVMVELAHLEGTGDMKFNSVSGDVIVIAPAALGADIEMSTLSGALETNFPLQIEEKEFGPGRSARGTVGAGGGYSLRLSTISGKVSLTGK
ncbi:MAG: hypothetical protein H6Q05_551 [Acidobacteria bacterium]|nr:hypothetical protein [Acidobacteriota bacterium]